MASFKVVAPKWAGHNCLGAANLSVGPKEMLEW